MSGRAIIVIVTGIIVITSVIFYEIEAASIRITENVNGYFLRQSARNLSQTGVNLALRQLRNDRTWRTGFSNISALGGNVTVALTDVVYDSLDAIKITSTAVIQDTQVTSTAYAFYPPPFQPPVVKGLVSLNCPTSMNGSITLDARDHTASGTVIANSGTYAIWTTSNTFTPQGGAYRIGGTAAGTDYAPANPYPSQVVALNQVYTGGYPKTPDSAFGGASAGYKEGTLKEIAKTGVAGSQYVTDPTKLKYPLAGITYVDLPTGTDWNAAVISGSGVIVVHNSNLSAKILNASGTFSGILVADHVVRFHANLIGAMIMLSPTTTGDVLGNGNASLLYSKAAIQNSTGFLQTETKLRVLAWWE